MKRASQFCIIALVVCVAGLCFAQDSEEPIKKDEAVWDIREDGWDPWGGKGPPPGWEEKRDAAWARLMKVEARIRDLEKCYDMLGVEDSAYINKRLQEAKKEQQDAWKANMEFMID
jgi:hypothetical protein